MKIIELDYNFKTCPKIGLIVFVIVKQITMISISLKFESIVEVFVC